VEQKQLRHKIKDTLSNWFQIGNSELDIWTFRQVDQLSQSPIFLYHNQSNQSIIRLNDIILFGSSKLDIMPEFYHCIWGKQHCRSIKIALMEAKDK
jgi:hypothetical protein